MMDFHKNVNISIFSYVFKGIFSLDHWKAIVHRKFKGKIYEEMSELYNQRYRLESPVKTNISLLVTKFKQTGSMSVCIIINIWWQNSEHKWRCWKESEFFDSSSPTLTWTFSKTLFDMHYVFPESVLHPATVSDSKKNYMLHLEMSTPYYLKSISSYGKRMVSQWGSHTVIHQISWFLMHHKILYKYWQKCNFFFIYIGQLIKF